MSARSVPSALDPTAHTARRLQRADFMKAKWKRPTFVEIRMNAEVGSYQDELDERKNFPIIKPRSK
jgi:hypothetical protein